MTGISAEPTLSGTLTTALALLQEGVTVPESPFHLPTLATLGEDGFPRQRTLVLRRCEPGSRLLELHSDGRSAKAAELRCMSKTSLHAWDAARRVQLRLLGTAACHEGDAVARNVWHGLPPRTRETYRVTPGPGTAISAPNAIGKIAEDVAFTFFTVLHFTFHQLEWLRLEHGSYARAQFTWRNGQCDAMWLVP